MWSVGKMDQFIISSEYQHLWDLVSRNSFEGNWFNFVSLENSDLTYDMTLHYVEYQSLLYLFVDIYGVVLLGELAQRDPSGVLLQVLFLIYYIL